MHCPRAPEPGAPGPQHAASRARWQGGGMGLMPDTQWGSSCPGWWLSLHGLSRSLSDGHALFSVCSNHTIPSAFL